MEHTVAVSAMKLWKRLFTLKTLIIVVVVTISLVILHGALYVVRNVMPETEMVFNSQCANPYWGWDGKVMDYPIYKSSFEGRPSYFNIHNEQDYNEATAQVYPPMDKDRPIVLWGTHHKTGTFVAKKIFAKICARMNWCCLFHVTRDSYHAVNHVLHTEKVDVLGHNMWLWNPAELNLTNYRFVHFYRHPFRKIVSGYRYHYDGTEGWTRKALLFDQICSNPLVQMKAAGNGNELQQTSLQTVFDYCAYTHLCETCCRVEHEINLHQHSSNKLQYEFVPADTRVHINDHSLGRPKRNKTESQKTNADKVAVALGAKPAAFTPTHTEKTSTATAAAVHHSTNTTSSANTTASVKRGKSMRRLQVGTGNAHYYRHSDAEYAYMCRHLGSLNASLQDTFKTVPMERGMLIEAALDYYENLRMAHLVNETLFDPRTLSIDLDDMTADFSFAIWRILNHLKGMIPQHMMQSLHDELMFYDLNTSPLYSWSMSNPLVNHVDPHASSSSDLVKVLVESEEVSALYKEVFELMEPAIRLSKKKKTEAAAATSAVKAGKN